ncbi:MAG: CCA tRNA nucleotidyltransferase [Methanomicrobiales archaeon]|nr:CCA tRNA nucleotidyltransferase [Methanomicrobiales archaeon]
MVDLDVCAAIHAEVLASLRPCAEEVLRLKVVSSKIIAAVEEHGVPAMLVGSVARGTWISGDRDLDIFMLFPPDLTREELEVQGMSLARLVAARFSAKGVEKYAEHPYLHMIYPDGEISLHIDLVPCYAVESASCILSAVDRTPFHTRYMQERIGPYTDDVLLFKQFTKSAGVYGSDLMTEGFSGYLCEVLILAYQGFFNLLQSIVTWKPGFVLDIESHQAEEFGAPLVVIDPVDPRRNVSASVSLSKLFACIEYAAGYLKDPSPLFFSLHSVPLLSRDEVVMQCSKRGTALWCMVFSTPPGPADTIVPQLRKSSESLVQLFVRHDFRPVRWDVWMGEERCMLLFEFMEGVIPSYRRHIGPPISAWEHAERFLKMYQEPFSCLSGPYIQDGRYVVELVRRYCSVSDLILSQEVFSVALGKQVRVSLREGFSLVSPGEAYAPDCAAFLSAYLQYSSPLIRLHRERGV